MNFQHLHVEFVNDSTQKWPIRCGIATSAFVCFKMIILFSCWILKLGFFKHLCRVAGATHIQEHLQRAQRKNRRRKGRDGCAFFVDQKNAAPCDFSERKSLRPASAASYLELKLLPGSHIQR